MAVFAGASLYLAVSARTRPGREELQDAETPRLADAKA